MDNILSYSSGSKERELLVREIEKIKNETIEIPLIIAIPPFNFYSIGGNLPTAPAMVGNVVLWKPSRAVIFCNYEIMKILMKAGLPPGVINFVPFSSKYADVVIEHPYFRTAFYRKL